MDFAKLGLTEPTQVTDITQKQKDISDQGLRLRLKISKEY